MIALHDKKMNETYFVFPRISFLDKHRTKTLQVTIFWTVDLINFKLISNIPRNEPNLGT